MRINVKVTPRASRDEVVEKAGEYMVRVRAAPEDGKANAAVIELLARHFHVPKAAVKIMSGASGRNKIVDIQSGR